METTTVDELGNESENKGCNWSKIWDICESRIYRVVDEEGNNCGSAQVRHLQGPYWLYVDDTDGFEIINDSGMKHLILEAEEE